MLLIPQRICSLRMSRPKSLVKSDGVGAIIHSFLSSMENYAKMLRTERWAFRTSLQGAMVKHNEAIREHREK